MIVVALVDAKVAGGDALMRTRPLRGIGQKRRIVGCGTLVAERTTRPDRYSQTPC